MNIVVLVSDVGVKQGCPLSRTLFGSYIDVLDTYLNEIDWDSLRIFNTVVVILHYHVGNVVLLYNFGICLEKLLN